MWTVAVLDQGISNWFEQTHRPNVFEYDVYDLDNETDYGDPKSHGTLAALSAHAVNPALGYIDLKIMNRQGSLYDSHAELALNGVIGLLDRGYRIGAVNLSWGGFRYPWQITTELSAVARRGVFAVASSGNSGDARWFDYASYPAALSSVIAVGSHDGNGNPSVFSQNNPREITVLARGENMPEPTVNGTSFAAPQVAATVASVQAYATATLGRALSLTEMKSVLRQGEAGPLSNPDPADGTTRYFLHDHAGSIRYFLRRHLAVEYDPMAYLASHGDLVAAFGTNAAAATGHFLSAGVLEGRRITFDGWSYLAANDDLTAAFGANASAAAAHYITSGRQEGRGTLFDHWSYLAANPDLLTPLGTGAQAAARHYVASGRFEGRATAFDAIAYLASYGDLINAFGADAVAATRHYASSGHREGRRAGGFDALGYLAANADLVKAFGVNERAAMEHYVSSGHREARQTRFNAALYLASNPDLIASFGADARSATGHYIHHGRREGRGMGFSAPDYLDANEDLADRYGADVSAATLHYVQTGWRENRPTVFDPVAASTNETASDFAGSRTSAGRIAVGGRVSGTFRPDGSLYASDDDWYRVRLRAGQSVTITAVGSPTGRGTLGGPYLRLYDDRSSWALSHGTNSWSTNAATLTYTARSSGPHFVSVYGYAYGATWSAPRVAQPYTLTVSKTPGSGAVPAGSDGWLAVA